MKTLSLARFTEDYDGRHFDLLIIGGGITGAALAYEASSRGLATALVEKDDFGGATSAATGKLIHGGLRYLQQFEIGLVRESLRERRILSNIAPNLVYPFPIVLPKPGLLVRAGLLFYDILSLDRRWTWDRSKRIPGHRMLSADEARGAIPGGDTDRALLYYDCLCLSPERLTLYFIKSAAAHGALVANYVESENLIIEGNRVRGAVVRDRITGNTMKITASVTVNATGPWTQALLNRTERTRTPLPKKRSEGIYLVTKKITDKMVLYVGAHGHYSFAPWRGHSLIGPTEKSYYGPVDEWKVTRESIDEFLDVINRTAALPVKLARKDVLYAYGGLRPLVETQAEDTYTASRRSDLYDHAKDGVEGLITAAGGKYTTSREFAAQIFRHVAKKAGRPAGRPVSHARFLYGCSLPDIEGFVADAAKKHADFGANTVEYLVRHYGTEYEAVLAIARTSKDLARPLNDDGEIPAQALFALRHESARSLSDIFLRRTGLGTLGNPGEKTIAAISRLAVRELGWSKKITAQETAALKRLIDVPK
ncbi:MAG: glycerol-3-phosphate dehydrogenase/oxidase [Spirochaetes bacterium]|nr:MAG: glycerol-3-phosphate dehydrogenase/oxidase [Spirochaetota bacterium]